MAPGIACSVPGNGHTKGECRTAGGLPPPPPLVRKKKKRPPRSTSDAGAFPLVPTPRPYPRPGHLCRFRHGRWSSRSSNTTTTAVDNPRPPSVRRLVTVSNAAIRPPARPRAVSKPTRMATQTSQRRPIIRSWRCCLFAAVFSGAETSKKQHRCYLARDNKTASHHQPNLTHHHFISFPCIALHQTGHGAASSGRASIDRWLVL